MTADQAAGFQSWHERLTAMWHGAHRDLAHLEAERDRKLSDIQQQYQQLIVGAWREFHDRAGALLDDLMDRAVVQQDQGLSQPLPLPAPTGASPAGSVPAGQDAAPASVQHGPGQRARPPWEDAPAPPAAAAPPDAGDAHQQNPIT